MKEIEGCVMQNDDWIPVEHPPHRSGHYLVVQENSAHRKYRWVRYWDGREWSNLKEEIYGPVTRWTVMPEIR